MASANALIEVFDMLQSAGLKPPIAVVNDAAKAVTVYGVVLGDASDEDVVHAAVAHIRKSTFWPSAGELLALLPAESGAADVSWGEGWAILVSAAKRGTAYTKPPERFHADAAVDQAIRAGLETIGGWRAYGMIEEDNLGTARAHFRDAYQAVLARAKRDQEFMGTRRALAAAGLVPQIEEQAPSTSTWGRADIAIVPSRVKP